MKCLKLKGLDPSNQYPPPHSLPPLNPPPQVLPPHLTEYLIEKRVQGYTLVGVEQTANSVTLEKFTFPKKTLLLLGYVSSVHVFLCFL